LRLLHSRRGCDSCERCIHVRVSDRIIPPNQVNLGQNWTLCPRHGVAVNISLVLLTSQNLPQSCTFFLQKLLQQSESTCIDCPYSQSSIVPAAIDQFLAAPPVSHREERTCASIPNGRFIVITRADCSEQVPDLMEFFEINRYQD
jgi:hypothetical protein